MSTSENKATIEPWVDSKTVAAHIGFTHDYVRVMARKGIIPGKLMKNAKKEYWRFKLSEVEAFMRNQSTNQQNDCGVVVEVPW